MKTILAIWHSANKGKTETLREFANLLITTYPKPAHNEVFPKPILIPARGDFRIVVEINGKIIGVESKGDPKTNLGGRLLDLSDNFNCDIILCTTRTKGETVDAVNNLVHNKGFQTIWTSTYEVANNHQIVNQIKAKHLLDLLQNLSLI